MSSTENQVPHHRIDPATYAVLFGVKLPAWKLGLTIVGIVFAITAPFILESFTVFQLTQVMVYAIAVLGLNLLTGYNGQFSLGHSAFYALGAYTAAIMVDRYEIAFYWTILPAGMICFVGGFLFGLPALRLEGLFLALATFALAVATPQLLRYEHFEHFTGGVQGIDLFKPDSPIEALSGDQWLYFVVLICGILMLLGAWNLTRGRTGRAIIAIRDNPIAARTMGINTALYKSVTFGVSGFYTGIAGALGGAVAEFVAPDSFTFFLSVWLLVGMVIGGMASIPAAIVGGAIILYLPNIAEAIIQGETFVGLFGDNPRYKALIGVSFGTILILAVYVMPNGLAGLLRQAIARYAKF